MKKLFAVMFIATTMCGCTLIYNGSVVTNDNLKAVEVSKALEAEYTREGFRKITPPMGVHPPEQAFYWAEWIEPVGNSPYRGGFCLFHEVRDGRLFIRIVPQPHRDDVSRKVAEEVRAFLTTHFPDDLKWQLIGTSEPDWFR